MDGCPDMTQTMMNPTDRQTLLLETGVGIGLVRMIEAAGYRSISELDVIGARRVLEHICEISGSKAWMHREKALQRVIRATNLTAT